MLLCTLLYFGNSNLINTYTRYLSILALLYLSTDIGYSALRPTRARSVCVFQYVKERCVDLTLQMYIGRLDYTNRWKSAS